MRRIKASVTALIIAVIMFIYVYKPVEHEQHAESPTESSQMIPPADDIAVELPPKPVKPYVPPVVKAEVKPVKAVVATETMPKQTEKPIYKRQKETKAKTQVFTASFYVANCRGCTGVTANGTSVKRSITRDGYRVIAADRSIPFGTKMRITFEDGTVINGIVDDRGGKIRGKLLDILVASYDEAIRLGRQKVTVQILN